MLSNLLLRTVAIAAVLQALYVTYDYSRRWLGSQTFAQQPQQALYRLQQSSPVDALLPQGLLEAARHSGLLSPQASLAAYTQVLSLDPLNAHLWNEFALHAMYAGAVAEGGLAAQRAMELGEHTRNIMLDQSLLGLSFAQEVDATTRAAWTQNLQRTLQAWPRVLAYSATTRQLEGELCTHIAPEQRLGNWCQTIEARRQYCEGLGPLPQAQAKVCRAFGYNATARP